jgi:pimeloyl-ACP methyl ester carboxylesterase
MISRKIDILPLTSACSWIAVAEAGATRRLVLYEPGVGVSRLVPDDQVERIERLVDDGRLEEALNVGTEQLDAAGLVRSAVPITGRPTDFLALVRTLPRDIRAVDALDNDLTRYSTIAVPTLLLIGGASPPRQQCNCEKLAAVLADVRVERLEALGHVAHNTAPDLVAGLIGSFLHAR